MSEPLAYRGHLRLLVLRGFVLVLMIARGTGCYYLTETISLRRLKS